MNNKIVINVDLGKEIINRNIYGHFAEHLGRCIYEGIWVGEDSPIPNTRGIRNDVVQALRRIKVPVLRWPGGCFADEYHWKDGIGPRENRPKMVNTHWGGVVENNHFGTHEFFDLCEMIGAEPYICGNVGSGTVREMQEWIEYMTFDGESPMANLRAKNGREKPWHIKYFGIGNENWKCGGNMRAEYYADEYRRYQTYVRDFGDNEIFKIACGPRNDNYYWTQVLMREAGPLMDGLALHYYTRIYDPNKNVACKCSPNIIYKGDPNPDRGSATQFQEDEWFLIMQRALFTEELIKNHGAIMDSYDPEKRVALIIDEWGTWFNVEPGHNPGFLYQQNTLRDALVAGVSLNIFNNHCDRVRMTNIAQTVNVLQAVILTEGEKMILTPTFHVYEMYKVHQDATLLPLHVDCEDYEYNGQKIPRVNASASKDCEGKVNVTLCNMDPNNSANINCELRGMKGRKITGKVLTSSRMNAHNTFENPNAVEPAEFNKASIEGNGFIAELPPMSVVLLSIE